MSNLNMHPQNIIFCNIADQPRNRHVTLLQVRTLWQWGRKAHQVHVQRHHLARLSPSALNDIGISRSDALREAARPFWDFPESR